MTETGQRSAEQWACRSCAWVYDPAVGFYDGEAGIEYEPYTPWEALPDAIVCPECGSSKASFRKLEPGEALPG